MSSRPRPGAKTAVTLYETLAVRNGLSLVAASSSPGAPIRSGPSSPPPATPCWETANMAASGRTSATAAAIRPCTPTGWSSASPPTPGRWLLWTDSSSRWSRWTS